MIELNEDQKLAVEKAQNEFIELKNNSSNLTDCLLYTSDAADE